MEVLPIFSTLRLNMSPFATGMMQAQSIASIFPSAVQSFLASPLLGVIDLAKQVASGIKGLVLGRRRPTGRYGGRGGQSRDRRGGSQFADARRQDGRGGGLRRLAEIPTEECFGGGGREQETGGELPANWAWIPARRRLRCSMPWLTGWRGMEDRHKRTGLAMELLGRSGNTAGGDALAGVGGTAADDARGQSAGQRVQRSLGRDRGGRLPTPWIPSSLPGRI